MKINKHISKSMKGKILSAWVYVKELDQNNKFVPVCLHYSSKRKFKRTVLPRQLSCMKIEHIQRDFSAMTQKDIDALPLSEEFIEKMGD